MPASDRLTTDRIEALLAGEAGSDERERRLGSLIDELHGGRIEAPDLLRQRVRALVAPPADEPAAAPAARRRRRLARPRLSGRLLAVGVTAGLVAAIAAVAFDHGSSRPVGDAGRAVSFASSGATPPRSVQGDLKAAQGHGDGTNGGVVSPTAHQAAPTSRSAGTVPTVPGRAQDYRTWMHLAVGNLASLQLRTRQAVQMVRRLGGYVVYASYQTPHGRYGTSLLEVRIPVARTQDAIASFSTLGSIAGQRISITDKQATLDAQTRQLDRLQLQVARLTARIALPATGAVQRAQLRYQLVQARQQLAQATLVRNATVHQVSYAKFALDLTTGKPRAIVHPTKHHASPGPFRRSIDRALGLLSTIGRASAFVLIVASPFLLLLAMALVTGRTLRRRSERRLLERV